MRALPRRSAGEQAVRICGFALVIFGPLWAILFFLSLAPDGRRALAGVQEIMTLPASSPCVAFAPDGKSVIAVSEDGILKRWNAATGKEGITFQGRCTSLGSLAFSPDGKTVAAACGQEKVKWWDAETGKERDALEGQTGFVQTLAFAPDGNTLVSGNANGTVRLWDLATRKERAAYRTNAGIRCLAYAPDGKTLASGDYSGQVKLWDVVIGKEIRSFKVDKGTVLHLVYAPDGKTLATTCTDGSPQVWDPKTGQAMATIPGLPGSVAFSPDGKVLALGRSREGTVQLLDAGTLKQLAVFSAHQEAVLDVAFSPNSKLLATVGRDHAARIWDVAKILEQKPEK